MSATQVSRDRDQAQALPDEISSTRPALVSDGVAATAPLSVDDSGQGQTLFVLFVMAALFVTGAVALLALVSSWWMLGLAFGLHVLATTVVSAAVFSAFGSGRLGRKGAACTPARPSPDPAEPVQTHPRSSHAAPLAA